MAGRETHVVLLPQGAGWEWYEALRDYVLRYRPTVTQSADDAVTFSGDPHIVTVIYPAAWNKPGVPRQPNQPDDIVAWLHKNSKSPGLQIDPVPWSDPAALKRALAERVLVLGRFGRGMRTPGGTLPPIDTKPTPPKPKPDEQALKLAWPTDYKVYTQKFGERPEFYSKFGLPGHEGVDIRCPTGTNVYACADGLVSQIGWRTANHPYGYSVRVRHKRADGEYETVYAHLVDGSAKVKEGDTVTAGQIIALGDNTGNSSASHLHLSLKKIGAKNGGYGEIVDPEPFFVDAPK